MGINKMAVLGVAAIISQEGADMALKAMDGKNENLSHGSEKVKTVSAEKMSEGQTRVDSMLADAGLKIVDVVKDGLKTVAESGELKADTSDLWRQLKKINDTSFDERFKLHDVLNYSDNPVEIESAIKELFIINLYENKDFLYEKNIKYFDDDMEIKNIDGKHLELKCKHSACEGKTFLYDIRLLDSI